MTEIPNGTRPSNPCHGAAIYQSATGNKTAVVKPPVVRLAISSPLPSPPKRREWSSGIKNSYIGPSTDQSRVYPLPMPSNPCSLVGMQAYATGQQLSARSPSHKISNQHAILPSSNIVPHLRFLRSQPLFSFAVHVADCFASTTVVSLTVTSGRGKTSPVKAFLPRPTSAISPLSMIATGILSSPP